MRDILTEIVQPTESIGMKGIFCRQNGNVQAEYRNMHVEYDFTYMYRDVPQSTPSHTLTEHHIKMSIRSVAP